MIVQRIKSRGRKRIERASSKYNSKACTTLMGNIIAIQESEQTLFGSIELEIQIYCPLKYLLNRHISLTSKIPEMLIMVGRLLFLNPTNKGKLHVMIHKQKHERMRVSGLSQSRP